MRFLVFAMLIACNSPSPKESPAPAEDMDARVGEPIAKEPVVVRTGADTIQYTVRFKPKRHYIEVEMVMPSVYQIVMMPTWTPGSYLVREYARFVEDLSAATIDGEQLAVKKIAKNRWLIGGASESDNTTKPAIGLRKVVTYRVYAHTMSVRDNYVDEDIAILIPAATFLTAIEKNSNKPASLSYDVSFELPDGYKKVQSGLGSSASGKDNNFVASSYDVLVDTPFVFGDPALHQFEVGGISHTLANFGEDAVWNGKKSAADTKKIVDSTVNFWGQAPYENYVFLNVIGEGRGGLEHKNSTLVMTNRWKTRDREDYLGWLGLVSHEFFHTWNVKRLRPKGLGPFDYENEVYTESLWIAEGLTSYYDDLILYRAGLMEESEYLDALSKAIETVETTPGRKRQSLSDSSFDTWTKYYRKTDNSDNVHISYYSKGMVVGFLLDAEIRRLSKDKSNLDDVMRLMYQRFSEGYEPKDFQVACEEKAGRSLNDFFANYVNGTTDLNYGPALSYYGLEFTSEDRDKKKTKISSGDEKPAETPPWLGVTLSGDLVSFVFAESPAGLAGISPGDEILAIDGYRTHLNDFEKHLGRYKASDSIEILLSRQGKLRKYSVTLAPEKKNQWIIQKQKNANSAARGRLRRWLTATP